MKTKIFAYYLPQYHETEENNRFWGQGFTDWIGVKRAKPQFEGHNQPRVPLNNNYYDLSDINSLIWQVNLAKEYAIDGFCIYHYWFKDSHVVLDKPARLLLDNKSLDISFFFCWDNHSWIRSWSNISGNAWAPQFEAANNHGPELLLQHNYGNEKDWEEHFYWLLPFFNDERYYKINKMPVFSMFAVDNQLVMEKMSACWNKLAIQNGLPGVYMVSGVGPFRNRHCLDAQFRYQPSSLWNKKEAIQRRLGRLFNIKNASCKHFMMNYEKAWKHIITQAKRDVKKGIYTTGLVGFDDTPRRGNRARILTECNPTVFEKYFKELYLINSNSEMPFLFLTAWNEWGEGAYLEPDTINGYAFLNVIKKIVKE